MLACGCTPTVGLGTGFVAFFPVLRSPAGSGWAGSCGFSSPFWFSTFVMGSPLRGRGWFLLDRNEGLACFSFPFRMFLRVPTVLRIGSPYASSVLVGSHCPTYRVTLCVKCVGRFPLVRALRLSVPHPVAAGAFPGGPRRGRMSSDVLGSPVFFPFRCYGSMSTFIAIPPGLGWSLVLCPRSFRIGFVPLSEVSLRALQLPARFLVVLHAAASLHVFWPLS